MLKRLWNRAISDEQVFEEAHGRLESGKRQIQQLNRIVDQWLESPAQHEWFIDRYRIWLCDFDGIDDQMWIADSSNARKLLEDYDSVMRRALTVRHAIESLSAAGHHTTAPGTEKKAAYNRSSDSPLGKNLPSGHSWEGPA